MFLRQGYHALLSIEPTSVRSTYISPGRLLVFLFQEKQMSSCLLKLDANPGEHVSQESCDEKNR